MTSQKELCSAKVAVLHRSSETGKLNDTHRVMFQATRRSAWNVFHRSENYSRRVWEHPEAIGEVVAVVMTA